MTQAWVWAPAARRRSRRSDSCSGSAAIQFAMIAPVLLLFLFGIIETGLIFFAQSNLQNAADDTARMVRTGQVQTNAMTQTQYISAVCGEMTGLISSASCKSNMLVDMRSYSTFASAQYANVLRNNGTVNANKLQFAAGGACDIVLVRVFYPWTIMTPFMAPLLQNMPHGQYLMTAAQAFRNEPYTSGASC
ncbi:MAG TPA: TadE/TadG family type IV pilus assembly protein [Rhizomicrobium sp.]|nr:TadE/TadG family type IV pilus assembly protein [Rhizomicrobium sp.]